jgi:hypothetical protein
MRFGWLTLSLSPSPEEDAQRIDQQIEQVRFAERLGAASLPPTATVVQADSGPTHRVRLLPATA